MSTPANGLLCTAAWYESQNVYHWVRSPENGERVSFGSFTEALVASELVVAVEASGETDGIVLITEVKVVLDVVRTPDTRASELKEAETARELIGSAMTEVAIVEALGTLVTGEARTASGITIVSEVATVMLGASVDTGVILTIRFTGAPVENFSALMMAA